MPFANRSFFDRILHKHGSDILIRTFQEKIRTDRADTLDIMNSDDFGFLTLYAIRDEIEKENLYASLCERNQIAYKILLEIEQEQPDDIRLEITGTCDHVQHVQAVLKWMLESDSSGETDMGFLELIDTAACVLIAVYRDRSILNTLIQMIFHRYQNGLPYHTLAWAFFEACEPYSLVLIGEHLLSKQKKERDCARKLLEFIPGIDSDQPTRSIDDYRVFCSWFEENSPFLKYKGESFDTIHKPKPYVTVSEAKYLGKFVEPETGQFLSMLTGKERKQLKLFQDLDETAQQKLASLSAKKRVHHYPEWIKWMKKTCAEQLEEKGAGNYDSSHR